jgi:hypothetical protein
MPKTASGQQRKTDPRPVIATAILINGRRPAKLPGDQHGHIAV